MVTAGRGATIIDSTGTVTLWRPTGQAELDLVAAGGPVSDQEFTDAGEALGQALPAAWRTYLQGESWFRRGWMATGAYVWLNTPGQLLELRDAWGEGTGAHPGIAIIGGDGSREQLVLDLRGDPVPVLLVDVSSSGWETAIRQADDVGQFIGRIAAGTFEFTFEG